MIFFTGQIEANTTKTIRTDESSSSIQCIITGTGTVDHPSEIIGYITAYLYGDNNKKLNEMLVPVPTNLSFMIEADYDGYVTTKIKNPLNTKVSYSGKVG